MFPIPCKPQPPPPTVEPPKTGCQTINGSKCIFPFIYKGETFLQCTNKGSKHLWCATETGPNGEFTDKNAWGKCSSHCRENTTVVQSECEFSPDCQEFEGCKTIQDAACVCVRGKCDKQGLPWQKPGGVGTECVGEDITTCSQECQADPSKCFCIYGECSQTEYECHNTNDCQDLYKCRGDVKCKCQNGVCEKDDKENETESKVDSEEEVASSEEIQTEKPQTVMTAKTDSKWVDRQENAPTTVKVKETTTVKAESNWVERPQKPAVHGTTNQGNKY